MKNNTDNGERMRVPEGELEGNWACRHVQYSSQWVMPAEGLITFLQRLAAPLMSVFFAVVLLSYLRAWHGDDAHGDFTLDPGGYDFCSTSPTYSCFQLLAGHGTRQPAP